MRRLYAFGLSALLMIGNLSAAEDQQFYLQVSPRSTGDLERLLDALEASFDEELVRQEPVVVVLHGEEASLFTRDNYDSNRALVDRAALLDAYNLIDMRMCETWMGRNNIEKSDLLPFVDTVPYAPEEIERLKASGYQSHPSIQI
jgi:intracellular sulfur oxidation DsrE/DsrF family protein